MDNSDHNISTPEMAKNIGLSFDEFQMICRKLERFPNFAELGIFSAMYSEHCSYKSSKAYLKRLPTKGSRVLQGPGENAGIIDIGEGWAIAFKMESHNHPSFIEPYQGAATGVGGILRDIFTMGARPIASMNGLCFGEPHVDRMSQIIKQVVRGIGDYGNSVGVPMVSGQTVFHSTFNRNPLVNAFTLGLLKKDEIFRGNASGIGNLVIYVGAKTGRDGVHGATMASKEFSSTDELARPTVQVGDPFTEKLLIEATLEAMREKLIVGIQDMGAAGLTSSSFEMADRANTGLFIDLDKIPTRDSALSAYELLLSESQERMLLVAEERCLSRLKDIYEKWDLHVEVIGKVNDGHRVQMDKGGRRVVDLPIELVVNAPLVSREKASPTEMKLHWFFDRNRLLLATIEAKFLALIESPAFSDPSPLYEQYDSMVGVRTVSDPYHDAALIRLREIETKNITLAMTLEGHPRVSMLWPREGGRRAVSEAAINLALNGAIPLGLTDCLNFGSPENPEVMWQFEETIEGISEAASMLKVPIVSGNVSLYNDTDSKPIFPTPMIGMVGIIEDRQNFSSVRFESSQMEIALVGPLVGGLGGSLLSSVWFKRECGKPEETDLKLVNRAILFCGEVTKRQALSIHDISEGGLLLAALEMALTSSIQNIGFDIQIPPTVDNDSFLFGELVPRILVAYDPLLKTELENKASQNGVEFNVIGQTNENDEVRVLQGRAEIFKKRIPDLKVIWKDKWRNFF